MSTEADNDPRKLAAESASLRHVSDQRPGLTRQGSDEGFEYRNAAGEVVSNEAVLKRIAALAIPPAWTDVWICAAANGHIQATGRDARGRKQYRYHQRWRTVRDDNKFDRQAAFLEALPGLRDQLETDLAARGLPRDKVLALVVRLLEETLIRVGNPEYARDNGSFGLTTLLDRHFRVESGKAAFRFKGKGGKGHLVTISDRRLVRLVTRCRELPGQDLFQYLDEEQTPIAISSTEVNDYIHQHAGEEFTAKDFRTLGATLCAAGQLSEAPVEGTSPVQRAREVVAHVAGRLGNTPAICRRSYIHPRVLSALDDPELATAWQKARAGKARAGLSSAESILLRYLRATAP